jgi:hypothetical protein
MPLCVYEETESRFEKHFATLRLISNQQQQNRFLFMLRICSVALKRAVRVQERCQLRADEHTVVGW